MRIITRMSRPPLPRESIVLHGRTVTIQADVLADFPDAVPFMEHLTSRGRVSIDTAVLYAGLLAGLRRRGAIDDPIGSFRVPASTAVRAYRRWLEDRYEVRIRKLATRFPGIDLRPRRLRIHSLVPPFPEKVLSYPIPRFAPLPPPPDPNAPPRPHSSTPFDVTVLRDYRHEACPDRWSLHIPMRDDTPAHTDPCKDHCIPIALNADQVSAIEEAFVDAWGNRPLQSLPNALPLFGFSPTHAEHNKRVHANNRGFNETVLSFCPMGTLSRFTETMGGMVTLDVQTLIEEMQKRPDAVMIQHAYIPPDQRDRVLEALRALWHGTPPQVLK